MARSQGPIFDDDVNEDKGLGTDTPPLGAVERGLSIETANALIQEIFSVGLTLASCAKIIHGPAADRLASAIDDLDAIIAHFRMAAFDTQLRRGVESRDKGPRDITVTTGMAGLIDELGGLARCFTELSRLAPEEGVQEIDLLDATHSVHRAVVNLAAGPLAPTGPSNASHGTSGAPVPVTSIRSQGKPA